MRDARGGWSLLRLRISELHSSPTALGSAGALMAVALGATIALGEPAVALAVVGGLLTAIVVGLTVANREFGVSVSPPARTYEAPLRWTSLGGVLAAGWGVLFVVAPRFSFGFPVPFVEVIGALALVVTASILSTDSTAPLVTRLKFGHALAIACAMTYVVIGVGSAVDPGLAAIEGGHRALATLGMLALGANVARLPRGAVAFTGFKFGLIGAAAIVAVAGIIQGATSGGPAYPLGLNKNFAGATLVTAAILLLHVHSRMVRSSRSKVRLLVGLVVLLTGLIATQSRAAIISGIVAISLTRIAPRWPRIAFFIVMLTMPILGKAWESVVAWSQSIQYSPYDPFGSRLGFIESATELFRQEPIAGHGLGLFEAEQLLILGKADPHNWVAQSLSETGIIGLVSLAMALGVLMVSLASQLRVSLAAQTAAGLIVARLLHGLLDPLWVFASLAPVFFASGYLLTHSKHRKPRP